MVRKKQNGKGLVAKLKENSAICFTNKEFKEAIRIYSQAISLSEDAALYANRSLCYMQEEVRNYSLSLDDANSAVRLRSKWPKAYLRKGNALEGCNRFEEAAAAYQTGLSHDANDSALLEAQTALQVTLQNLSFATEEFTKVQSEHKDAKLAQNLCTRLRQHGAIFPKVAIQFHGFEDRTLRVLANVRQGEHLIFIPATQVISLADAKQSPIGSQLSDIALSYPVQSLHSFFAAFLLEERAKSKSTNSEEKSEWKAYIDLLPSELAQIPLAFPDQLFNEMKGTLALELLFTQIKHLSQEYQSIVQHIPSFSKFTQEEFVWARCIVQSRMIVITNENTENSIEKDFRTALLSPLADFMNHSLSPNCVVRWDFARQGLVVKATRDIAANEQLFVTYSQQCNSKYFLNYGFVLENNRMNEAVIGGMISVDDPLYFEKAAVLNMSAQAADRKNPIKARFQLVLDLNHPNSKQVLSFARLAVASTNDMKQIATTSQQKSPTLVGPLNWDNEGRALYLISRMCGAALNSFVNTNDLNADFAQLAALDAEIKSGVLPEGKELEKRNQQTNMRNILIVRTGEKQVLLFFSELAKVSSSLLRYGGGGSRESVQKLRWNFVRQLPTSIQHYFSTIWLPLLEVATNLPEFGPEALAKVQEAKLTPKTVAHTKDDSVSQLD